jgi:thiamine biosynthesis lipoprotein
VLSFLVSLFQFLFSAVPVLQPSYSVITGTAQGTTYQVKFRAGSIPVSQAQVDSTLHTIDLSLSLWLKNSRINRFNGSIGPISVDMHMKKVVSRSMDIFRESGGTFDITVKPLVDAWGFGVKGLGPLPEDSMIHAILPCVGGDKLKMQGKNLSKSSACVQIDCNGIAQGYSVDVLADFLEQQGIHDYLVELGGEIRVRGLNPQGKPWSVGIEDVQGKDDAGNLPVSVSLQPGEGGITTAGNYRKFIESEGHHYTHVIDPRTGYPVENGVISVTVRARTAMDADAWDDALMVLGIDSSFSLLRHHPELQARFIFKGSTGEPRDTATAGFYIPAVR